jgi:hypothetical protein
MAQQEDRQGLGLSARPMEIESGDLSAKPGSRGLPVDAPFSIKDRLDCVCGIARRGFFDPAQSRHATRMLLFSA